MSVKRTTSCDVVSETMRMRRGSPIRRRVCLPREPLSSFPLESDRGNCFGDMSPKQFRRAASQLAIPSASARPRPIRRVSAGKASVIAIPSAAQPAIISGNRSYGYAGFGQTCL